MTWANNGTHLAPKFGMALEDLTDSAFRLHVEALCWSNFHGRDMVIPKQYVRRLSATPDPDVAAAELVAANIWADLGDSYDISDQGRRLWTQPTAELRDRRRSRERDRQIRARDGLNERVMERDDHKCVHCGTGENLTVDHIHPQLHGGSCTGAADDMDNLQTLCRPCNSRKGSKVG